MLAAEQDALDPRNLQDDPDVADSVLDIQQGLALNNQELRTVRGAVRTVADTAVDSDTTQVGRSVDRWVAATSGDGRLSTKKVAGVSQQQAVLNRTHP